MSRRTLTPQLPSLQVLAIELLEAVTGGGVSTERREVTVGPITVRSESSQTDYKACVESVRQACTNANTSLWGWGPTNHTAVGECVKKDRRASCDKPPS
ncbi:MAG: hypothetical protein R3B06_10625 [Kofleriaceae bacterium]